MEASKDVLEKEQIVQEKEEDEDEGQVNEKVLSRLYRKDFPEEGDLVITEVTKVHENGAYVRLLEYEDLEGLILPTEVTTRRVRSINKLIKVGK